MNDISGLNLYLRHLPAFSERTCEMATALGISAKAQVLSKEIAELLASQSAMRVVNASASGPAGEPGSVQGATGAPSLDNPDSELQREADLEKLISYLQLDTDKRQAELAKERIDLQKGDMERRQSERMAKLRETLEQMDNAARASTFTRIFGWIAAALTVAIAVAASVATGGIAVGAFVAAGVAIGMCVLNETGVLSDLTEKLADLLKENGMDAMTAQIVAGVAVAAATMALTVGVGLGAGAIQSLVQGGAQIALASSMAAARTAQTALQYGAGVLGVATTVAGGVATGENYKAGMLQGETKEMEKFLAVMHQRLEESQEELERILEQIQNMYSDIAAIINSEIDAESEIAEKIGRMA